MPRRDLDQQRRRDSDGCHHDEFVKDVRDVYNKSGKSEDIDNFTDDEVLQLAEHLLVSYCTELTPEWYASRSLFFRG